MLFRSSDKGFGFITPNDDIEGVNGDAFFHISGVADNAFDMLNEGDTVSFDLEESQKGWNAVNVTRGAAAPAASMDQQDEFAQAA